MKSASKGGSNAIKSLAGVWIERFGDVQQSMWDQRVAGATERILSLVGKHKSAAKREAKQARA